MHRFRTFFGLWLITTIAVPVFAASAQPPAPRLVSIDGKMVDARRVTPTVRVFADTHNAVVNISSTSIVKVRTPFGGMFNQLFQMPDIGPGRTVEEKSVGSGFVIQRDGYIVTNAHVVARTAERKAIFSNGKKYTASIVAIDTTHDLALLKVNVGHPLATIKLGHSDDVLVGEPVVAIGNPFGYENTLTHGVVSALHRTIHIHGRPVYKNLIQTDASINPGNSGGPLLNILGQLIGINTAIRAGANNIGFAIPVDRLRELLPRMLDVQRRYHIVTGLNVSDVKDGAKITTVHPDSPAAKAGLKPGQIITAIDQTPVHSLIDYDIALIGTKAGQSLKVALADGSTHVLTLGKRPLPDGGKLLIEKFGIQAQTLSKAAAARMGVPNLQGLVITDIQNASPADQQGFQVGDVIIQIGQHEPQNLADVGELLDRVQRGQRVPIGILRIQGNAIYRMSTVLQAR